MIVSIQNNLDRQGIKTFLSHDEPAGAASVRWKNPNGFGTSWAIQIGDTGYQTTEVVMLGTDTPSLYAGSIYDYIHAQPGTTSFDHAADTPIYGVKYDKVVFLRSTAGTGGTAISLSNGTIPYTPNSLYTNFDDVGGISTYAYKTYFLNSATGGTSGLSDWITFEGPSFYSLAKLRQRAKDKLWNSNFITDDIITDWINELKDTFANAVIRANEDYAMGTIDISFGSNGLGTITEADFSAIRRFDISYNSVEFYKATHFYEPDYYPDQIFSSTHPYYSYVGNNVFRIKPEESGGVARLSFYRFGTTMVNDTDELPYPMRSFTKSFVDYVKLNAQFKDEKIGQDVIDSFLERETVNFVKHVVPRDLNTPGYVKTVEASSGDWYPIL